MTDQPYLAVLLYETTGGDRARRHEDFLLVRADSPTAARERAQLRGRNQSYRYVGPGGEKLEQRLLAVESVTALTDDDLAGDTELLSREVPATMR
ncbi:DUF4288 domain-containing protein [Enemella sp. A6]|uniref:DUF4288 domain-containing protein n=1 Tax=Enemella sp. A6 TaxID=3440152 RepID=UPI003EBB2ED7